MKKVISIILFIFFIILIIVGVIRFTVGFKELYYFDIDYLQIPQISGFSKEDIKLNYDYLIDYNLGKEEENFDMPTIKYSNKGKIHFEEVRYIIQNVIKIFIVCFIVCFIGIITNIKNKNIEFLKITSKVLIIIPLILSLPLIFNFDKSFTIFHEILFDNDYWIFDPNLDPVINILPKEFFLHAGIMILGLILIASILNYILYRYLKEKIS